MTLYGPESRYGRRLRWWEVLRLAQELEDKGVNLAKMSRHERRRSEKLLGLLAEQRELER